MKVDKNLKKIINRLVLISFDTKGQLLEKKANEYTKALKSLNGSQGILALSEYLKGMKREINKTTLEIETAVPLSAAQIKEIVGSFKGNLVISEVKTTLNEGLFGGIRVKIGDMVYDDSVSQKIYQLKGAING